MHYMLGSFQTIAQRAIQVAVESGANLSVVPSASGGALQDPNYYRQLTGIIKETDTGKGVSATWQGGGTLETFWDAILWAKTNGKIPRNALGKMWINASIWVNAAKAMSGWFHVKQQEPNYRDWNSYLSDLEVEGDIERFLSKLLLVEAAGGCLQGGYDFKTAKARRYVSENTVPLTDPATLYPYHFVLWDYDQSTPNYFRQGLKRYITVEKLNPMTTDFAMPSSPETKGDQMHWIGASVLFTAPPPPTAGDTVNTLYTPASYLGYSPGVISGYCQMVVRYWERILTFVMQQSFLALSVAKLEDEGTVRTVLQRLLSLMPQEMARINKREKITVAFNDGTTVIKEYTFDDFSGTIPVQTPNGLVQDMTIKQALQYQCEMAFWYGAWKYTMQKLGARVLQLSDPTAFIKESAPGVSWQKDPWENPFLVPDLDKSAFVNIGSKTAGGGTGDVNNDLVDLSYFAKAPAFLQSMSRTRFLPSGAPASALEVDGGGAGKSNLPWIAALAAAGVGAFFMLRG